MPRHGTRLTGGNPGSVMKRSFTQNSDGSLITATAAAAAALAAPMPTTFPSLPKKAIAPAKKTKVKYCKAPGAPKRFKSAFIFFTMHRHKTIRKEIEEKLGKGDRVRSYNCIYFVATLISMSWHKRISGWHLGISTYCIRCPSLTNRRFCINACMPLPQFNSFQ